MSFLLDACIVIDAYSLGVWKDLVAAAQVVAPSIVIHNEAQFYESERGAVPTEIDLSRLLGCGMIEEEAASTSEMRAVLAYFDRSTREGLDPGEIEALAIIERVPDGTISFCTADRLAVEALAMLGHSECGVSMEAMLDSVGLHRELPVRCTERRFRQYIEYGRTLRLQGKGKPY